MSQGPEGIWLKVANAQFTNRAVRIQVEGDQTEKEPTWWSVVDDAAGEDSRQTFRTIVQGLDKQRIVLARLDPSTKDSGLRCTLIRVQHKNSRTT